MPLTKSPPSTVFLRLLAPPPCGWLAHLTACAAAHGKTLTLPPRGRYGRCRPISRVGPYRISELIFRRSVVTSVSMSIDLSMAL